MTKQYDICLLPGDGIGPEIIAEGVKVLNAVGAKYDTRFDCKELLIGGAAIDAVGDPLPAATLEAAKAADAVLLAAVGGPKWDTTDPGAPRPEAGLLGIRKAWACTPTCVPCRSSMRSQVPPRLSPRSSRASTL